MVGRPTTEGLCRRMVREEVMPELMWFGLYFVHREFTRKPWLEPTGIRVFANQICPLFKAVL